jgi:hypothetical protein
MISPDRAQLLERIMRDLDSEQRAYQGVQVTLDQLIEKWESRVPEVEALARSGWTVPVWASSDVVTEILQAEPPSRDQVVLDLYRKDSDNGLKTLKRELVSSALLVPWATLVQQAIEAYDDRRYAIAVPALLTVCEGALLSLLGDPGLRTSVPRAARSPLVAVRGMDRVMWASVVYFFETLYAPSPFTGKPPSLLNRHWVLHGRTPPSWSAPDCLRLLQALHTMSAMAQYEVDGVAA